MLIVLGVVVLTVAVWLSAGILSRLWQVSAGWFQRRADDARLGELAYRCTAIGSSFDTLTPTIGVSLHPLLAFKLPHQGAV